MGKYELLYIVHPDMESSIDKITDRVKSFITERKGKITYEENWGKRKLAYEIKKSEVGIYILVYFEAPKEIVAKIERDLRLSEELMRFIVLSTDKKPKEKVKRTRKTEKIEETIILEKEENKEKPVKRISSKETAKKIVPKKKEEKKKEPEESEEERMKKLDEKLGAILGEEEKDSTSKK